jgi:hypothetical protein
MRGGAFFLLLLAGCPDDPTAIVDGGDPPSDAGPLAFDAGRDAGALRRDASVDASTPFDAARDGAIPFDASPSSDAASDAPSDAALDATPMDARACDFRDVYASIEFTHVSSPPGCFFFSGPGDLGLEYSLGPLGQMADVTQLSIGGAHFAATASGFERSRECPGRVTRFRFTEVLDGAWVGDVGIHPACAAMPAIFRGTYRYDECQEEPLGTCAPTDCVITADVTITLLPAAPTPAPMDGGVVDGGHDIASVCTAACAAQDAAAAASMMCAPDAGCIAACQAEILPGTLCGEEAVDLWTCAGDAGASAFHCLASSPPQIVFATPGPCEDEIARLNVCRFMPDPSDRCEPPTIPSGTGVEGDACTVRDDCSPGLFCEGPTCAGAGVCTLPPGLVDCLRMPRAPVCGCDGEDYSRPCQAARAAVRVDHAGECAP